MKFRNSIDINEPSDFELIADDILTDWIEGFTTKKGLIRDVEESDDAEDFIKSIYTDKGMNLYLRNCDRLKRLGLKIFPDAEFDIKSSAVITF